MEMHHRDELEEARRPFAVDERVRESVEQKAPRPRGIRCA